MSAFDILSMPRAPAAPTKAVRRYQQLPLTPAVPRLGHFNGPITTQAQNDRTNAIKGKL